MFKAWCKQNGFCNQTNLSHVLMDGGCLSVPFDRLNDFYEKYVECIKSGEKLFVVEQKTIDAYNFFVDLDYKDDDPLTIEEVERICRVICDKVSKFGGKDALVSVAKPKPSGDYIKTGVHINWPNFPVNRSSAIALRDHIIQTLTMVYGSKDWKNIVDLSVYGSSERNTRGSGFRMPFSHKKAKHEACGGEGCEGCNNTGKETQGEYLPILRYKHGILSMFEKVSHEPSVDIMFMATLRTQGVEPNVVVGSNKKEGAFTASQTKNEFTDQATVASIETFIRKNMEGQANARVTKVYKHQNSYLISTNSRYCENRKREHGSNHVWFHIMGDVLCQKCFCKCETLRGRHYGFCKDFSGRKHQLPPKITENLSAAKYKKPPPKKPKKDISQAVPLLNEYIEKHIFTGVDVKELKKIKANVFDALTENTCGKCDTRVSFSIKKKIIKQVCKCNTREHMLSDKIVDKL